MLRRLCCFVGWHMWTWKLTEEGIVLNGPPPDYAKCECCGVRYGKEEATP